MSFQVLDMLSTKEILNLDMVEIHYLIHMLFIRFDMSPIIKF